MRRTLLIAAALAAMAAGSAQAQDTQESQDATSPCRAESCRLYVDWGAGGTPTTVDRRYGTFGEFQRRTLEHLNALGNRYTVGEEGPGLTLRLRPQLVNAMCDVMPGTNPDMSCRTIGDLIVDLLNADPALKLPGNIRIRNRCGSDQRMDVARFSEFAAAMITYELSREEKKKRPSTKC